MGLRSSLVPSVLLYSNSGIPFHSTLSAFLECDTLHSVEWNGCCNMHSIPWSECVWTHSRHTPAFEFSLLQLGDNLQVSMLA